MINLINKRGVKIKNNKKIVTEQFIIGQKALEIRAETTLTRRIGMPINGHQPYNNFTNYNINY